MKRRNRFWINSVAGIALIALASFSFGSRPTMSVASPPTSLTQPNGGEGVDLAAPDALAPSPVPASSEEGAAPASVSAAALATLPENLAEPEILPTALSAAPDPAEGPGEPTLANGPRSIWEQLPDVEGASVLQFNRVAPGVTAVAEVIEHWGTPIKKYQSDGQQVLAYKVPGFKQVDLLASESTVESILIHLLQPVPVDRVALDLNLRDVRPVLIPDSEGNVLGQGFPERGVLLHYSHSDESGLVSAILLEPIGGELFRLRAEYDFAYDYAHQMADLQRAVSLDPHDTRAICLLAKAYQSAGQLDRASSTVDGALEREPQTVYCQLTHASILADAGNVAQALETVRPILANEQTHAIEKAEAQCVLGDLLAHGPTPDYAAAMEHHLKAIQLSVEMAGAEQFLLRRSAKRILIRAHAGTARDIAGGYFQRQSEVVPKWLDRAQRLAVEYLDRDQGDPLLGMELYRRMLDAYALLPTDFDPQTAVDQILTDGRRLIADHADKQFQQCVEWEMAMAMYQAGEIERARGNGDRSLQLANNAMALFENARTGREFSAVDRGFEGQLYFLIGALYAVHKEDHVEAAKWYDKAQPLLHDSVAPSRFADYGMNGERFVSMGVSFWEAKQQQRAIDTTLQGITFIQKAVQEKHVEESSLAVPYGNLATMHQNMGNPNAAQRFARMMAKFEQPGAVLRR